MIEDRLEYLRRSLQELLNQQKAPTSPLADTERLHIAADEALLWYVGDDETIRLFDALEKRY